MDIASKKLPLILIGVLLTILVLQIVTNDTSGKKFIDPQTCEIWIDDKLTNKPHYLDEYDEKCLEFKSLNPDNNIGSQDDK